MKCSCYSDIRFPRGPIGGQIRLLRVLDLLDAKRWGIVVQKLDRSTELVYWIILRFLREALPSMSEGLTKADGFGGKVSVSPALIGLYASLIIASRISLAALRHE
jgi:hypothetical protein